MSNTFFTSDLHFFHKKIVDFTERKEVTTAEDHTEWLIKLWNDQVESGDVVYHLGDFTFGTYNRTFEILSRLKGRKIFIKGNHDNTGVLNRLHASGAIEAWCDYKEIKIDGHNIVLFHFPIVSWHKQGHGSWHLHGHCHGNLKHQFKIGKMLDVGIDNLYKKTGEHKFADVEFLKSYMDNCKVQIADHHRENV